MLTPSEQVHLTQPPNVLQLHVQLIDVDLVFLSSFHTLRALPSVLWLLSSSSVLRATSALCLACRRLFSLSWSSKMICNCIAQSILLLHAHALETVFWELSDLPGDSQIAIEVLVEAVADLTQVRHCIRELLQTRVGRSVADVGKSAEFVSQASKKDESSIVLTLASKARKPEGAQLPSRTWRSCCRCFLRIPASF